ncbi:hypothetical protein BHM03_00048097 [Ensete ventricosum]|nr:hypothetical protein BHM03_00048097 [Ensete ventricosum]
MLSPGSTLLIRMILFLRSNSRCFSVVHRLLSREIAQGASIFGVLGPAKGYVYFESDDVHACIVTCGGLCPGLNTVIREIVCGLSHMYGVSKIIGIEARECQFFTLIFEESYARQVYIIGGDGTQKGAAAIFEVIDKSFGFDTAVEEAQRAINAAHVEAGSVENGIGVVKLMGRYSVDMYIRIAVPPCITRYGWYIPVRQGTGTQTAPY